MRHLEDDGRFLLLLMDVLGRLEKIVVVEAVARRLFQVLLGRENEDLLEGSIVLGFPESLISCFRIGDIFVRTRCSVEYLLLEMLLELHIQQHLRQIEMHLVDVLHERPIFMVFIFCTKLVNRVENKMSHLIIIGISRACCHIHKCINYFPDLFLALT